MPNRVIAATTIVYDQRGKPAVVREWETIKAAKQYVASCKRAKIRVSLKPWSA